MYVLAKRSQLPQRNADGFAIGLGAENFSNRSLTSK